jgi:hypothetical protein
LDVFGSIVAAAVAVAVQYFAPGIIIRWIFGYGAGCYVAVPHYGLIHDDDVPGWLRSRHVLMDVLPVLAFVGSSILFATGIVRLV